MAMDAQQARAHAEDWVAAWNARDLEAIMGHYAPEVCFTAPTVISRWGKPDGVLVGKEALHRHFARGLELAPDVHFELIDVLMGVDGMTVLYRRETGALVTDVVVFDEDYKGIDVRAYYTPPPA